MEEVTAAYQRGRYDSSRGWEITDNPYPANSQEAKDWELGWIFNDDSTNS